MVSLNPHARKAFPTLGAVPAAVDPASSTLKAHSTLVLANNCLEEPRYGRIKSLETTSLACGVIDRSLTSIASAPVGVGSVP